MAAERQQRGQRRDQREPEHAVTDLGGQPLGRILAEQAQIGRRYRQPGRRSHQALTEPRREGRLVIGRAADRVEPVDGSPQARPGRDQLADD
jgi:hypothetical protein